MRYRVIHAKKIKALVAKREELQKAGWSCATYPQAHAWGFVQLMYNRGEEAEKRYSIADIEAAIKHLKKHCCRQEECASCDYVEHCHNPAVMDYGDFAFIIEKWESDNDRT